MGTNYYLQYIPKKRVGPVKTLHVGKSSAGWRFCFHYIKDLAENVEQWRKLIGLGSLWDEYDTIQVPDEFWEKVEAKQDGRYLDGSDDFLVDGYYFCRGEFS